MKGYDLLLHFENSKYIAYVAALAKLMDFPIADNDCYGDEDFWCEEVSPALGELFDLIEHYIDTSPHPQRLMGGVKGTEQMRQTLQKIAQAIETMEEWCDEFDAMNKEAMARPLDHA